MELLRTWKVEKRSVILILLLTELEKKGCSYSNAVQNEKENDDFYTWNPYGTEYFYALEKEWKMPNGH